jgi:hypothetical protein
MSNQTATFQNIYVILFTDYTTKYCDNGLRKDVKLNRDRCKTRI